MLPGLIVKIALVLFIFYLILSTALLIIYPDEDKFFDMLEMVYRWLKEKVRGIGRRHKK